MSDDNLDVLSFFFMLFAIEFGLQAVDLSFESFFFVAKLYQVLIV